MKKPIGLVIKEISEEKGFKVKTLSQLKGITPQAVHDVFKRSSIGTSELDDWATILNVSPSTILERTKGTAENFKVKEEILVSNETYLMRRLNDLEEMVQFLKQQVTEKDTQIRVLLGKSDSVSIARLVLTPIFFGVMVTSLGTLHSANC